MEPSNSHKLRLAALRGARLFRGVEAGVVEALANAAHASQFREGELLWRAGQPAVCFTVIQRGLVRIERRLQSGEWAILGIFGPRESVGDAAVLGGQGYPAEAIATSDRVDVVRVPRDQVLHAADAHPALAKAIQQALLEHTHALTAKIDIISAGSVSARLATLLLHLAARFGDENESGQLATPVALSRVALSRLVSARTETVIRTLSAWSKQGLFVSDANGFILVDPEALSQLAREG